ncbi:energy transducer TonB [Vibrio sp. IRLE0018]|uniref:energy transducer TonB n=1 Tax=Vibrio floridensis TaxID=2908007 RepID=UPI001F222F72|nr:energy transducer TonB [Vibrio floridensis]MCF8777598.1 energy transducer TonB [Vibrio floridensis]
MNLPRYVFAGSLSLMLHAALLSAEEPQIQLQTNTGSESPTVAVNLVSRPTPVKPVEKQSPPKKTPQQEKPTEQKPLQEKKTEEKPSPVKKVVPVEKRAVKTEPKQPITTPKKKTETTENMTSKSVEKEVKKTPDKEQKQLETPPPTPIAQGATSKPVLIEKPSFMQKPVQPKYPRVAQKRGIEGTALFEIWLDEQGHLVKLLLINSSGAQVLDDAAQKAIKQWRFSPHSENGIKMPSRVKVPVRFSLE